MRCASDVGGTFTDFVFYDGERITTLKLSSTPAAPEAVVAEGLRGRRLVEHLHGTTVATNAILEGKGARTALVTTAGFEDMLVIGRQSRPSLYDLTVTRPEPLVPRGLCFGLGERVGADGHVLRAPDAAELERLVDGIRKAGVESVAISFLFSFLDPSHERLAAEALAELPTSLSHEVLAEFREYERTSTTALDAYVKPLVRRYLESVGRTGGGRLLIMQSNGGIRQASSVASRPSEVVLSGPAGGVAGALHIAGLLGVPELLTLDMGGTSTDVSILLDGRAVHTTEGSIGGFPVALPRVAIETIGAGGGSIAWRDLGGALRVGPRSAGADPGPLAYGRGGGEVTVTDGDLLSGLLGGSLLGGKLPLHRGPAEEGVARLAQDLGLEQEGTLLGMRRVVEANMARAASLVLARRGLDPRDFALLAFGGAGPLHAALLAEELGIRQVIIPFLPGLFSAYGILVSDLRFEFSKSVLRPWGEVGEELEGLFEPLRVRAREELENHGEIVEPALLIPSLDLRYRGQSFHLNVPLGDEPETAFHEAHQRSFGYSAPGEPLELVNLRLSVLVPRPKPLPSPPSGGCPPPAERQVLLGGGWVRAEVHERDALAPGFRTKGPAVIEEESSTTFVPPSWRLEVDGFGILHLEGP